MIALSSALLLAGAPIVQAQAPIANVSNQAKVAQGSSSLYRRYLELAQQAENAGRALAVIAGAKALIREDPDFAPAYVLLARAYRERGQSGKDVEASFQAARRAAETAIKIDPGLIAARGELGSVFNRLQRPDEGRSELIVGFGPVTRGLGYLNWRAGRLAEAWQWLRLGQALYPTEDWALRYSGFVAHDLGAHDEAERLTRALLRLHGNTIGDQVFLASLLTEDGDTVGATAVARQLFADVDQGKGSGGEAKVAAVLAFQMGEVGRALKYAERAVQLAPDDARVWTVAAYSLSKSNPSQATDLLMRATKKWQTAVSDGATDFQPHLELARIEAIRGGRGKSLAYLRNAVSRGFRNSEALKRDPMLSSLYSTAEFQKLLMEIKDLVKADRAKLGFPPVRPPS